MERQLNAHLTKMFRGLAIFIRSFLSDKAPPGDQRIRERTPPYAQWGVLLLMNHWHLKRGEFAAISLGSVREKPAITGGLSETRLVPLHREILATSTILQQPGLAVTIGKFDCPQGHQLRSPGGVSRFSLAR